MNPTEALTLTRYARAAFPQQRFDEYTPDVWAKAFADLAFADCQQAVDEIVKRQTFASVADIRAEVRRIRDDRLRSVPSSALDPADVDPNDLEAYQAARLALIRRIADGEPVPERPALPAHDPEELLTEAAASMRRATLRPSPGYLAASRALAAKQRAEGSGVAS